MQTPKLTTPVRRCLIAAGFSARMLSKFSESPRLTDLSQRLSAAAQVLAQANDEYTRAEDGMLALRVDTIFENYASDQRVRRTHKLTEIADGRKNGRIATQLFPQGVSSIVELRGHSQIVAMKDLENRLEAVMDLWPEAKAEKDAIAAHRVRYETALQARDAKEQEVRALRAARDATKERFVHLFAEASSLVKAEFPRDRMLQDMFFISLSRSGASGRDEADVDDELDTGAVHDQAGARADKAAAGVA